MLWEIRKQVAQQVKQWLQDLTLEDLTNSLVTSFIEGLFFSGVVIGYAVFISNLILKWSSELM